VTDPDDLPGLISSNNNNIYNHPPLITLPVSILVDTNAKIYPFSSDVAALIILLVYLSREKWKNHYLIMKNCSITRC
jgi:hypothetical protein